MYRKIKETINSKLQYKFIIPTILVIVIVMFLTSVFSYTYFSRSAYNAYLNTNERMLHVLGEKIYEDIEKIINDSFALQTDILFYPEYYSSNKEHSVYNYKIKKLQNIFLQNSNIDSVLLYFPDHQEVYVVNNKLNLSFKDAGELEKTIWYRSTIQAKDYIFFEPAHRMQNYDERYMLNNNHTVFSINRAIMLNNKVYGILRITYKNEFFNNILKSYAMFDHSEIYLFNAEGAPYSTIPDQRFQPNLQHIQNNILKKGQEQGHYSYTDENTGILMVGMFKKLPSGDFLLQIIPKSIINMQARFFNRIILVTCLIVIILLTVSIFIISTYVTKPLVSLKRSIHNFGRGSTDVKLEIISKDEVGEIVMAFNNMTEQVNTLINEKYKLNIENKQAQLKQLLAQINPHFLYNTLESIGSVAHEQGAGEVESQLQKLAEILRYTIKGTHQMVSLKEEISNTKKYLAIQKFRFEERLSYCITAPEEIKNLKVPKLLIQPLIENAIIHGIEKSKDNVTIYLNIYLQDVFFIVEVSDNGLGMPKEMIQEYNKIFISKSVAELYGEQKIGIMNIFNRLVLRYGNDFDMVISEGTGGGLTVRMSLPIQGGL